MKKKLIIFLSELKIRKHDILRFDLQEFEGEYDYKIEIHELIDFIHPGFSSVFTNTYEDERIKKFDSFFDWKERVLSLKKDFGENILIINQVFLINLKCFKINYFIKKNKFKTLTYRNYTFPIYESKKNINYFFSIIKKKSINFNKFKIYIKNLLISLITKRLKLLSNYSVVFGEKDLLTIKDNKFTKVILGNSYDYNMYLKYKGTRYIEKNNYALFLESPSPVHNLGDSYLTGNTYFSGTKIKWLNSINKFFDFIEDELKIKILIAPHPKIKHPAKFSKLYKGREVAEDGLYKTSKNAKLIISRDSTGFSYAAIYKIPAIFIYTNELLDNNRFLNQQKCFASSLGLKPVNIDNRLSSESFNRLLKFDENIYENYIKNYLSTRKDEKKNFEIINESIS